MSAAKLLLMGLVGLTLASSGAIRAQEGLGDPQSERYSELEKTKSSFRDSWVLPGTDFNRYDKIYFWEGVFEYRDVGPATRTTSYYSRSNKTEFPISEEGRRDFEQIVGETFSKEMQRGKHFRVADKVGPNTLIIRGGLLDIVSNVPPETTGRVDTYLANIGEATLVVELIDAETGTVLAMVSERRKITNPSGGRIDEFTMRSNRTTVIADIRRWATSLASRLRSALDKAMKP